MHFVGLTRFVLGVLSLSCLTSGSYILLLEHKDVNDGLFSNEFLTTMVENENNVSANTYSIIGNAVSSYYLDKETKYKFKLQYYAFSGASYGSEIIWKQTSWLNEQFISGFQKVSLPPTMDNSSNDCVNFKGLALSGYSHTLLDANGAGGCRWGEVGIVESHPNRMYAGVYDGTGGRQKGLQLYVYSPFPTKDVTSCSNKDNYIAAIYDAESLSVGDNIWYDLSGNGHDAMINGSGIAVFNGTGTNHELYTAWTMKSVYGTTFSQVVFPTNLLITEEHSIVSMCKYMEIGQKQRILEGGNTYVFGFWNGNSGVAYSGDWLTDNTHSIGNDWVISSQTHYMYRANGIDYTLNDYNASNLGDIADATLSINKMGESSDWSCTEIIISQQTLDLDEIECIENYLNFKYDLDAPDLYVGDRRGASYPSLLTLIQNYHRRIDYIESKNGYYTAVLETDGNLRVYYKDRIIWSTAISNYYGEDEGWYQIVIQNDSNLCIYAQPDTVGMWCSQTSAGTITKTAYLVMHDDGELILYNHTKTVETILWSTNSTYTFDPTFDPTLDPTSYPTQDPTMDPTLDPTTDPTIDPTIDPSIDPTTDPTLDPTIDPTYHPTNEPSYSPSIAPSNNPTSAPSLAPSISPTTCYEMDGYFSNDGMEQSIAEKIINLEFVNSVDGSKVIVAGMDEYFGKSVYLQHDMQQQLECSDANACLLSNIVFENNDICNLICDGSFSCTNSDINMHNCTNIHIICNGKNACSFAKVDINATHTPIYIDCGVADSCEEMTINILNHNFVTVSCYDANACDYMYIDIEPAHYRDSVLYMYSHSRNVTFSNSFGYEEEDASKQYMQCNTNNKYIKINNSISMTQQQLEDTVLNEYIDTEFSCNGLTIECYAGSNESVSTCDMKYNIMDINALISNQSTNLEASCYWAELNVVLKISCEGTCVTSPTYSPTTAPTSTPTFSTSHPTNDPTFDPTIDPTLDPTMDPTINPTDDPTLDPTFAPSVSPSSSPSLSPSDSPSNVPTDSPSNAPSNAPSISPSTAPSFSPSVSPSNAPTIPPTNFPTLSPSNAPSIAPTQPPSNAPSFSPSNNPTTSPTRNPSNAPTQPPTDAPSYSPSSAPSRSPTTSPSGSPTQPPSSAPSRNPTQFFEKIYDTVSLINYQIFNLTEDNIYFTVDNTKKVIDSIREIIEMNYFASETMEYTSFWVDVLTVNNVDIELEELSIYDLDVVYLAEPMVLNTRVITKEIDSGSIIRTSETQSFTDNCRDALRNYFNNTHLSFLTFVGDTMSLTDQINVNVEKEDWAIAIISICIISVGTVISIAALIKNKSSDSKVDNATWTAPLLVAVQIYDLLSDFNLAFQIFNDHPFSISSILTWCGFSALAFTIIPFASNIWYAITLPSQKVIKKNSAASAYFKAHLNKFLFFVVTTGGCYPALSLVSSRLFALDILNSGLTKYELTLLSKIKVRSTISLENAPQLVTQILYTALTGKPKSATLLAFVASLLSIITTVATFYAQRKQDNDDHSVAVMYSLHFYLIDSDATLDAAETMKIEQKKEKKLELMRSLCRELEIAFESLEIGFIKIVSNGCHINIVHYVFQEELKKFSQSNWSTNTNLLGFNVQIDPEYYMRKLIQIHAGGITQAIATFFELNPKQFKTSSSYEVNQDRMSKLQRVMSKSPTISMKDSFVVDGGEHDERKEIELMQIGTTDVEIGVEGNAQTLETLQDQMKLILTSLQKQEKTAQSQQETMRKQQQAILMLCKKMENQKGNK